MPGACFLLDYRALNPTVCYVGVANPDVRRRLHRGRFMQPGASKSKYDSANRICEALSSN